MTDRISLIFGIFEKKAFLLSIQIVKRIQSDHKCLKWPNLSRDFI